MKPTLTLIGVMLMIAASLAQAEDYKLGSLQIVQPWSRATPKGASVAAGYMKITNTGTTPDRLIGGSSPVAGALEVHEMSMDNGVMKMRPVKAGLVIKPGETVELKPGSFHVMLVNLKQPIKMGDHVKATLQFEKAGTVDIEYDVLALGATPGAAGNATHGGMSGMPGMGR